MMQMPNYECVHCDNDVLLLRDLGPWDMFPTITNAAERLVEYLIPTLGTRRLLYYDSHGELTEIVVADGGFAGFRFPLREAMVGKLTLTPGPQPPIPA